MRSLVLVLFTPFFIIWAPKIQGSYGYRYGNSKEGEVGLLKVHYSGTSKPLFYLEVDGGAPAHNSGALYGSLTYNSKTGDYEYLPEESDGCKLSFIKIGSQVTVKTLTGDCGFGHGVYADGKYRLKNKANPQYCITRTGKKVLFDKTPPGKFRED